YMSALGARKEAPGPYHRTKFTAETLVRESGLDWTIFRPSVIFGPGDKFVNRLAGIIRKSPFIPVIGSGRTRLQPMSVRDVGAAVCLAVGNPVSFGKTYDLGGPEALSYEEIFRLIASVLKIKKRVVRIPEALVYPGAYLSNWLLPDPPITPGQLAMMGEDNICNPSDAVHDFQLSLKPFEAGIREYLKSNL
ncbi:MAG TPA: NAD-dependent epimerase/dehydratase family protein, partial [Nitrospiria bacterium]|nr:NAD-dependent epimerase/dehydratase family protein [Nitrospiria bacterium]